MRVVLEIVVVLLAAFGALAVIGLVWEWAEQRVRGDDDEDWELDDDLDEDLINLHHHRTPFEVLPTLVRDYLVEAWHGDGWDVVAAVAGNRVRHRRHRLPAPVTTTRLRVTVTATNGADAARIVSLRAWAT